MQRQSRFISDLGFSFRLGLAAVGREPLALLSSLRRLSLYQLMIRVFDRFLDDELVQLLLGKFPALPSGSRTALSEVLVPRQLEQHLREVLRDCAEGREPILGSPVVPFINFCWFKVPL